jgi:hypothetical protein
MAIVTKEVCYVAIERTASMSQSYVKDEIVRVFDERAAAEKFARAQDTVIVIEEVEKG